MLKPLIEEAFNDQLNAEFYSAYLYLSMASFLESHKLSGMAQWMKIQAKEELTHGMKFFNFINERGGKVTLKKIDAPPLAWKDPLNVFLNSLSHERHVTSLIHKLVSLAEKEKDSASLLFLKWFVSEQVEEEESSFKISEALKRIKDNPSALSMIDKELGTRKSSSTTQD
jgi:ferritin